MHGLSITILIPFIISIVTFLLYPIYFIPRMTREILRPYDFLTRLRWIILTSITIGMVTAIPSIFYQYSRLVGNSPEFLMIVTNITSNVSRLVTSILLVLIFSYQIKDKKDK